MTKMSNTIDQIYIYIYIFWAINSNSKTKCTNENYIHPLAFYYQGFSTPLKMYLL